MRLTELFEQRSYPIFEKRRNSQVNRKTDALDELKKYAGQNDVFVTFMDDLGVKSHEMKLRTQTAYMGGIQSKKGAHNVRGAKLGINPQSGYNTPLGVYAYPIDYVISENGKVPFAGDRHYMYVFRASGNILDLATYSQSDLSRDIERILDNILGAESLDTHKAKRSARVVTPAGMFWNITRVAAQLATSALDKQNGLNVHTAIDYGEDPDPPEDEEEYWEVDDDDDGNWDDDDDDDVKEGLNEDAKPAKVPVQWNWVMRRIGYDGVVDSKGQGIIHESEPTQAVFFNAAKLKPLQVIDNVSREEQRDIIDVWMEKPHIFYSMFAKGKVTDDQFMEFMKKCPKLLLGSRRILRWEQLPKVAQDYLTTYFTHLNLVVNLLDFDWMPYTDDMIIDLLKTHQAVGLKHLTKKATTPKVIEWMRHNLEPHALTQITWLPDDVLIDALQKSPSALNYYQFDFRVDHPSAKMLAFLLSRSRNIVGQSFYHSPQSVAPEAALMFVQACIKDNAWSEVGRAMLTLARHNEMALMHCIKKMTADQLQTAIVALKSGGYDTQGSNELTAIAAKYRPDLALEQSPKH